MERFVFYDFETSGAKPAFDQPLQFAAIVTDDNFNELDRMELRCQLSPHILPSPIALHVTGVRPGQLLNSNLVNQFEFAQRLQSFIKTWAPAIWVGYNSIQFDEEVMRHLFYQNLQPTIYATQRWGNSRLDAMKMIWAVYDKAPGVLVWPTNENGLTNFKLDQLAPANGFANHNAHDAMGDVEALIFLLYKIKSGASLLYDQLVANNNKHHVKDLITAFKPVEITLRFGASVPKTYVGCFCGSENGNPNRIGFFDLNQDNAFDLINGSQKDIEDALNGSPKKIRTLAINKADTFTVCEQADALHNSLCAEIQRNEGFRSKVSQAMADRYLGDEQEEKFVEEKIYDGFVSGADEERLIKFQSASWRERQELVSGMDDVRLRQLGRRLIAFYAPELLNSEEKQKFSKYICDKWSETEKAVSWTTMEQVQVDLVRLKDKGVPKEELSRLKRFYEARFQQYGCEAYDWLLCA
jgi:exodeoxyribonuclease-1